MLRQHSENRQPRSGLSARAVAGILLPRWLLACVFAGFAVYAVILSEQDERQGVMLAVAAAFDHGTGVPPEALKAQADNILAESFDANCRGDILRPALTIMLHRLDTLNIVRNYDEWANVHMAAESFVQQMIRCRPADGNVWLREAVISSHIAEDAQSLKQKLTVAQSLMPYEAEQIMSRVTFMKGLSPYALVVCGSIARADIYAILRYGSQHLQAVLNDNNVTASFAAMVDSERSKFKQPSS